MRLMRDPRPGTSPRRTWTARSTSRGTCSPPWPWPMPWKRSGSPPGARRALAFAVEGMSVATRRRHRGRWGARGEHGGLATGTAGAYARWCWMRPCFPGSRSAPGWVTPRRSRRISRSIPRSIRSPSSRSRPASLAFEGARHETGWRRPASYGIIRREFDHFLLERAAAAGADVRWGIRVTGVSAGPDRVTVETERGAFEAPVVIGAGGHRCPVARALGEISVREQVVVAQESETRLSPEWTERLRPFLRRRRLYVEPDSARVRVVLPEAGLPQHRHRLHRRQRRDPAAAP